MPKIPMVGLALGSGAARGIAHIGVLKVLDSAKIPIDLVVGTSVGSLIGSAFAVGVTIKRMEELASKVTWRDLTDFTIPTLGLNEGRRLEKFVQNVIENKGFEHSRIKLAVVTLDIENGEEVVFTSGPLASVIRASCSIPGIFSPVRIEGRLLVDGGIKHIVPAIITHKLGADFIIAVDVGANVRRANITNIFQVIYQASQIKDQILNVHQSMPADVIIRPELGDFDQIAFHKGAEAIKRGEEAALAVLPEIQKKLEEYQKKKGTGSNGTVPVLGLSPKKSPDPS